MADKNSTVPSAGMPVGPRRWPFLLFVLVIVRRTVLRSTIATRLDDFTIEERYHIVAGVSYVQRGGFRNNPQHPPLVKLWVGSVISSLGFSLESFHEFNDKQSERNFANQAVYVNKNPETLQHRARIAMWILNDALLLWLANSPGPFVAIGTLMFLTKNPTVSAHLPRPLGLLSISLHGTPRDRGDSQSSSGPQDFRPQINRFIITHLNSARLLLHTFGDSWTRFAVG